MQQYIKDKFEFNMKGNKI